MTAAEVEQAALMCDMIKATVAATAWADMAGFIFKELQPYRLTPRPSYRVPYYRIERRNLRHLPLSHSSEPLQAGQLAFIKAGTRQRAVKIELLEQRGAVWLVRRARTGINHYRHEMEVSAADIVTVDQVRRTKLCEATNHFVKIKLSDSVEVNNEISMMERNKCRL